MAQDTLTTRHPTGERPPPAQHRRGAAPYARALFDLARTRNEAEVVGRELAEFATTFASDPELHDFFARPWISAAAKRTMASEIARRSGFSELSSDFVALLAGRGRADSLTLIAENYQKLLDGDVPGARARGRRMAPLTGEARGAGVVLDVSLEGQLDRMRRRRRAA